MENGGTRAKSFHPQFPKKRAVPWTGKRPNKELH